MLQRTFSAAALNQVANHPDVRPFVGGSGELDLTEIVGNPANVTLETEGGGFILQRLNDLGMFELHTLFAPTARGKAFFGHAREMFRFMFARTDCLEISTKCPDDNPGARMAAGTVGFRERFRRENAWAPGVGISYRVFALDDWFTRDAEVRKVGEEFHAQIEAAKKAKGSDLPVHPEDEAHDRAVGAALMMALNGHFLKGIAFYNRWAQVAGYAQIVPIADSLVDIQDAVLALQGGRVEIILLR